MNRPSIPIRTAVALVAALGFAAAAAALADGKKILWKPVPQALLKLNNHAVKTWDVLQAEKNSNLILVQVDRDWYVLNLKQKRVYKTERGDFLEWGNGLFGPEPGSQTPVVKTKGWDSHNIGPAQQITVHFAESGDVLAVELPHPFNPY